jgi:hypothetical protein
MKEETKELIRLCVVAIVVFAIAYTLGILVGMKII